MQNIKQDEEAINRLLSKGRKDIAFADIVCHTGVNQSFRGKFLETMTFAKIDVKNKFNFSEIAHKYATAKTLAKRIRQSGAILNSICEKYLVELKAEFENSLNGIRSEEKSYEDLKNLVSICPSIIKLLREVEGFIELEDICSEIENLSNQLQEEFNELKASKEFKEAQKLRDIRDLEAARKTLKIFEEFSGPSDSIHTEIEAANSTKTISKIIEEEETPMKSVNSEISAEIIDTGEKKPLEFVNPEISTEISQSLGEQILAFLLSLLALNEFLKRENTGPNPHLLDETRISKKDLELNLD